MTRRSYKRLSAAEVKKLALRPGMHPDGDGLYLQVAPSGAASWIWRYYAHGKQHYLGLGPVRRISLAEARRFAENARRLRHAGTDPIEARRADRQDRRRTATAQAMKFRDCAEAYIAEHAAGWRNAVHARQWPATLETYVYPVFGDIAVSAVDTALVLRALQPIWSTKTETASRLRGRIETVLDWATSHQYRHGDNPARWRSHLENLLPKPSRVKRAVRLTAEANCNGARGEHHEALPYSEIGDFVVRLRSADSIAARALEFTILTAARTGEVVGARWDEIDLAERQWTIPAARMKKGDKEHRVPLSDRALAILDSMAKIRSGEFVFPGRQPGKPIGPTTMLMLLRRIGRHGLTVHGFRSTFRDWAAERTSFPAELAEMALAHTVGSAVERAYRRSDLFDKRRQLAQAWADYCGRPGGFAAEVIALDTRQSS